MRNSAISSAKRTSLPPVAPPRNSFALTGPSRALDPRTNAVRPDIADVRLAAHVFAPHYAAPARRVLTRDAVLREARPADSAVLATMMAGEAFDLLEITSDTGWGIATDHGLVGYVDADALARGAAD